MSRRGSVQRVGSEQLALPRNVVRERATLEFTNSQQFRAIPAARPLVLFYKDNADDENPTIFDPELDEELLALHSDPFATDAVPLQQYEACVTRASYECRMHPQQAEIVAAVRDEIAGIDPATIIVMVYRRDAATTSISRNRQAAPFRNMVNGLVDGRASTPLLLFTQHSFEPYCRALLVWQREPRINSTIGLIAFQIIERV